MADSVLILGGGLAGVACAHKLGDEGVAVTLVDRNDYHQFQPLLYQVASSQLPAEDIARPHRTIFKDYPTVTIVNADVAAANTAATRCGTWLTAATWWSCPIGLISTTRAPNADQNCSSC